MTDYIKNKIESQRKIQAQMEIEGNKEYVNKMTKKQKNSINITPDDELLALIDKESKDKIRTRKAQVEYIIKQYFKDSKEKLIFKE